MKSLKTLIKLSKQELDEKRRELAELEKQKDELIGYSKKMEAELKAETEFAAREPEMSITFDNYRKVILHRQANIAQALRDLNKRTLALADKIALIFSDMKKYEIILEQQIAKEEKERKNKEEKNLNEIALNNFLRSE